MKILVVGDAMRDEDVHCEIVKRYEDVPVLRELRIDYRFGGAGNVHWMCEALGVSSMLLSNDLDKVVKRRLMVHGKMVARYDTELAFDVLPCSYDWNGFHPDAVIVADHGKGFVQDSLLKSLPTDVPVFVDPFRTTGMIEGPQVIWVGSRDEIPEGVTGRRIVKRGSAGLDFVDGPYSRHFNSECLDAVDDVGAGDQFIVCLAIARVRDGMSWWDAIDRANKAAGRQCQLVGIQPLTEF